MSVELTYGVQVTAVETLTTNMPAAAAGNRKITHNGYNSSANLTANSTPPVTLVAAFEKALSSGTATIDLTALVGTNGATVNGNGLKVQVIKIRGKTGNANPITIAVGASNGYQLAGADFSAAVAAGQEFVFYGNEATPDIGGSAKTLDLTGTGAQAVECIIVMG